MKTALTLEESLKREQGAIFTSDFSERTLLAVSHSKNCIEAIEKQISKKKNIDGNDYVCPVCGDLAKTNYCGNCGQKLNWAEQEVANGMD